MKEVPGLRFHDIKPPPSFFVPEVSWAEVFVLLAATAALIFALRKVLRRTRVRNSVQQSPEVLAREALQAILKQVRARELTAKAFGSELSLTLRTFLEQVLLIPALEFTSREVRAALRVLFERRLPLVSQQQKQELIHRTTELLAKCEALAFAPYESESDAAEKFVAEALQIVDTVTLWVTKENERIAQVGAPQSSLLRLAPLTPTPLEERV